MVCKLPLKSQQEKYLQPFKKFKAKFRNFKKSLDLYSANYKNILVLDNLNVSIRDLLMIFAKFIDLK